MSLRLVMAGAVATAVVGALLIVAVVDEWGTVPVVVLSAALAVAGVLAIAFIARLGRRVVRMLRAIQHDARRARELGPEIAKLVAANERQGTSVRRRSSDGDDGPTMVVAFGDTVDDPALADFLDGFEFGDVVLVTDRSDVIARLTRRVVVEFAPVPAAPSGTGVGWMTVRLIELINEHGAAVLVEWPDEHEVVVRSRDLMRLSVVGGEHLRPLLRTDRTARQRLAQVERISERMVDRNQEVVVDRLNASVKNIERSLDRIDRRADKRSESTVRAVRSGLDDVYRQVESLSILYRSFDGEQSLPHLRGWAVSPDLAVDLVDRIRRGGVRTILELGSGASTVLFAMAFESIGDGHVTTLDHEARFAQATQAMLEHHGVAHRATVLHTPLVDIEVAGDPYRWYGIDGVDLPTDVDLLFVDGPPESTGPHSRLPAFPMLRERLADRADIVLDDGRRPDEQEIAERWAVDPGIVDNVVLGHERQPILLRFERVRAGSMAGDRSES